MKSFISISLFLVSLLAATAAQADAGLRIVCDGEIDGAEVTVNGVFKGECPLDLKVPAGTAKVSVRKKVSEGLLWFYQEFRLGDGTMKKVDVWPLLLSAANDELSRKAEKGDVTAIATIAIKYSTASKRAFNNEDKEGVSKNCEQAMRWSSMAVDAGYEDYFLLFGMSEMYRDGCGVGVNASKSDQLAKRAVKIALLAAEKNEVAAFYKLGLAYHDGQGVAVDKAQAINWMKKAEARGLEDATYFIGEWAKE